MKKRCKVQLISDDDPKVFDADTGEDITSRCREISILPGRNCRILTVHQDGGYVFNEKKDALLEEEYEVVEISGRWVRRGYE